VLHGFVFAPDGTFTTFDPQGSLFTDVSGMTPVGTVASFYIDANGLYHGYVRAPNGKITFDILGAGAGSGQGTFPESINTEVADYWTIR
jgi:hypothetical protein